MYFVETGSCHDSGKVVWAVLNNLDIFLCANSATCLKA